MKSFMIESYNCGLIHFVRQSSKDKRGSFSEIFRKKNELGLPLDFVQDNLSSSKKGVLRGLHLQSSPHAQAKLITCLKGEIFDVAVDLRPESPTFKKYWSFLLTEKNCESLYVPTGFAHGFCTLSEEALIFYKVSAYYSPTHELVIKWNDKELAINWPLEKPKLSKKDQEGLSFDTLLPG